MRSPWQNQLKQMLWQWRGVLTATPTTTVIVCLLKWSGALQGLELNLFDQFLRGKSAVSDQRIVIVEIQEPDLQQYGHPIADKTLAELLDKIRQQEPRAIGLDLYRDLPIREGYSKLANVFQTTPNLIGITKLGGPKDLVSIAPPPELAKQNQIAANDVVVDGDGKVRRGLMFLTDRKGENTPTLGMTMALMYLQGAGIEPEMVNDTTMKLGTRSLSILSGNEGGYVRADAGGYQLMLSQRIQPSSFQRYSLRQVLAGQVPQNWGRDRVVLIGPTAESLNDLFYTSSSPQGLFQPLQRIPGVDIHAQLTSQLISTALDRQAPLQTLPDWVEKVWIGSWALIGAVIIWQSRYGSDRKVQTTSQKQWQALLPGLRLMGVGGGLAIGSYVAFLGNWWLPFLPSTLALFAGGLGVTAYQAQKTSELRKTLGRYLTDDVVANLLENPEGITLKGETRKITTLFSDIRGFTSLSEQYPAEKIVAMLNLYLAFMTEVIQSYGGTINDLMGDGIIVLFGAPVQKRDDTERAIACALAMQQAMHRVNQQNELLGFPQLEMGIGLNTGEVVVGNIGSEAYMKYTAIGSHVNLAARVETFTVGGQVLISEGTLADVKDLVQVADTIEAQMKGVAKPVTLYDITGITGKYNLVLQSSNAAIVPIANPLPITYGVLAGKQLGDDRFTGEIIALSEKDVIVRSAHLPKSLSNLKLELTDMSAEIYAKVLRTNPDESEFTLRFTMMPDAVSQYLQSHRD
jgi:adenylate cyclase